MRCTLFTLCSNNYLAQAKTLGDSIANYNPDYNFIIGLVDRLHQDIDYSFFEPYEILPYNEIGFNHVFDQMIENYNIVEFNTAVKPFYFRYFFESSDESDIVYYIDPDIEVFSGFKELERLLQEHNFLLTPHILYPLAKKGQFEQLILNVGIFNLGFLAVKKKQETFDFLNWWSSRLINDCRIDFKKGLFVDQHWINFLPVLFDHAYILKDPGYNVGYWNFQERKISKKDNQYLVNGYPLKLFHFSSYNPLKPDILCHWLKYSFDKRPDLKELYDNYKEKLLSNRYVTFSKLERSLGFAKTHPRFDKNAEEGNSNKGQKNYNFFQKVGLKFRIEITKMINRLFSLS